MPSEKPMNDMSGGRSAERRSEQARAWRLSKLEETVFEPGQSVVWAYRPQVSPRQIYLVEAQVVYAGPLRARIRLCDTEGHILLRWVKPERLRPKQAQEAVLLYPAGRMSR